MFTSQTSHHSVSILLTVLEGILHMANLLRLSEAILRSVLFARAGGVISRML